MSRRLPSYDAQNRMAARVILADIGKYGEPESLMVRWARLWQARHGSESGQQALELLEAA